MKRKLIKKASNKLSIELIQQAQKEAWGYDEVAFFYNDSNNPYMIIGVNEDVSNGIAINHGSSAGQRA